MSFRVKICGLSTPETVAAACDAGADLVGFVFHPKSPRYITPARAAALARSITASIRTVALTVDADMALLCEIRDVLAPAYVQCHGRETAGHLAAIRHETGVGLIKALGVESVADLAVAPSYAPVSDLLLIDAKPPRNAAYPGGHGKPFDWRILRALDPAIPFMLSGGLTPATVGEAIRSVRGLGVNLAGVDVSSGVESAPGVKDVGMIWAFVAAARSADHSN